MFVCLSVFINNTKNNTQLNASPYTAAAAAAVAVAVVVAVAAAAAAAAATAAAAAAAKGVVLHKYTK